MPQHAALRSRRRQLLVAAAAALAAPATLAARAVLSVLTGYPDRVATRIARAFALAHPDVELRLQRRSSPEALALLSQPDQGGVDVYWAASPANFERLADAGAWQPLALDRGGLPARLGATPLVDARDRYAATELAGFVFACHAGELARLQLAAPADWAELAQPRLAGRIALPHPLRSSWALALPDLPLQQHGWSRGWALWSEIVGLAAPQHPDAGFTSDQVADGAAAVGVSLDFFVAPALAREPALLATYPRYNSYNPGHVAITAGAPNAAGARRFARFLLSAEGQTLLTRPEIGKLPVRPAAYADLPRRHPRPPVNDLAGAPAAGYDAAAGRARLGLVAALFEQTLLEPQPELAALWRIIHAAEARGQRMTDERRLLAAAPLAESEAADPALRLRFGERRGAPADTAALQAAWRDAARRRRDATAQRLRQRGLA